MKLTKKQVAASALVVPLAFAISPTMATFGTIALADEAQPTETATTGVATVNGASYDDLQQAVWAAKPGDTVQLTGDVKLTNTVVLAKDGLTLDLNGHKIYNEASDNMWGSKKYQLIGVNGRDKNITITDSVGGGSVESSDGYCVDVAYANLTIKGGTFKGVTTAVQVEGGQLSIEGGDFSVSGDDAKYLINCIDSAYKSGAALVSITGGTYKNFDPAASPEGDGTSYLAKGVTAIKGADGSYSIATAVASVGDKSYATVQDAVWDAKKGDTIKLTSDVKLDTTLVLAKDGITLDLNGHKIYNDGGWWDAKKYQLISVNGAGKNITITDSVGGGSVESADGYCIDEAYANLTIKGGTFKGVTTAVQVEGGAAEHRGRRLLG